MNFHKALLPFSDNENFLQHIVNIYLNEGIEKIIMVINSEVNSKLGFSSEFKVVENKNPELGRMHSLKLGLNSLKNVNFCFVQNVDNPFVTNEIISALWKHRMESDFTAPVYKRKGGHPILISKKIIRHIVATPDKDQIMRDVLGKFEKKNVSVVDKNILVNINTKGDYMKLFPEKIFAN